jgi:dTDP-L-rhamnose 4-epimerase
MYEIERYFSVNVQGTATLLDLMQNDPCGKSVQNLVVASSRAIYGEGAYHCASHGTVYPASRLREHMEAGQFEPTCPKCNAQLSLLATPEDAPFKPMSVYGLTKQVQEQAVLMLARTLGINAFGLRYQNVYGPGQSLKNPYTGILAVFSNLARQNQPVEIYEDGEESRDFVYIDDVVEATVRCVNHQGSFVGALNVGSGQATSVMAVAQEVKEYFGSQSIIGVTGAFRMGDIRHNIADVSLMGELLGFVPEMSFKQGLTNFLSWAESQPVEDKTAYLRSVSELSERGLMGARAGSK